MLELTGNATFQGSDKVPAKDVSHFIHHALHLIGARERMLAQGVDMPESQFNRLAKAQKGSVKAQTIRPLKRLAAVLEEAEKTFSKEGMKHWLLTPHPALSDVMPLLCLRTDKELEKVLSLMASIRYGFPA